MGSSPEKTAPAATPSEPYFPPPGPLPSQTAAAMEPQFPPPPGPPPTQTAAVTEPYFPPPPGPPPSQQATTAATAAAAADTKTAAPEYQIPVYNPADPTLAAAPAASAAMATATATTAAPPLASPGAPPVPAPTATQAPPSPKMSKMGTKVDDDHSGPYASTKHGFADRLAAFGRQAAAPINQLANKMGSEGFLPSTLDKECEKAARILKGFCKDGIYTDQTPATGKQPVKPRRALITIPAKVLQRAVGLAIFTTGRVGFHVTGATGSGVLLSRLPDGHWSPPSGIQIHSLGAGFVFGADIYDCVLVMNTQKAVDAFRNTRMSLGSDLAVVAGPWGAGGSVDIAAAMSKNKGKGKDKDCEARSPSPPAETDPAAPTKQPKPTRTSLRKSVSSSAVYAYVKSRGIYAGVQVDGTVITPRQSANAAFYGNPFTVDEILQDRVPPNGNWETHVGQLLETIRIAEGQAGAPPASPSAAATALVSPATPAPSIHPKIAADTEVWANAAPAAIVTATTTESGGTEMHAADNLEQYYLGAGTAQPMTKAEEAAMETAQAKAHAQETLPGYSVEDHGSTSRAQDLPPAYEDDGQVHPDVGDHKTQR